MASAFEHKSLRWLRERFEQGDVPTGYDFARLIDSCHNSLANTDTIITGNLTVSGEITCLGDITGNQTITTNDPRVEDLTTQVDQLTTLINTNSASWDNTLSINNAPYHETLQYLYQKFQDGDTPDQQDFQLLISTSHNTLAHTNEHLSDLLTVVQTHSAAWFSGSTGGGPNIDTDLRTFISTNSASWETQPDVVSLLTTVSSNSASWMTGSNNSLEDIYSVVSTSSADWSSVVNLTTTVKENSGTWGDTIDIQPLTERVDTLTTLAQTYSSAWEDIPHIHYHQHELEELHTLVESNSGSWSEQTDITPLLNVVQSNSAQWNTQTDITPLLSVVQSNSAGWAEQTDITPLLSVVQSNSGSWSLDTTDTELRSVVQSNSAQWNTQTDITPLLSVVQSNSAAWSEQTDMAPLLSVVQSNSAQWNTQTDITPLLSVVQSNSGSWSEQTDITPLLGVVQSNSAAWSEQTDMAPLLSVVQSNSSQWSVDTTDTELRSVVQSNSAGWAEQTDITPLLSVVQSNSAQWSVDTTDIELRSVVQSNSAGWAEQTDISALSDNITINSDQIATLTSLSQTYSSAWEDIPHIHYHQHELEELHTLVGSNSAAWGSGSTGQDTELRTLIQTHSAEWDHDDHHGLDYEHLHYHLHKLEILDAVIAANSANWDSANIGVIAGSANWENTYNTVMSNSAYWGEQVDIEPLTTTVRDNSGYWGEHTDITQLTNTVSANSAAWALDTTDTELRSVVQSNSAGWSQGQSGGGGSVGAFVTNITCGDNNNHDNGITQLTEDDDEIAVDGEVPVVSALVDSSDVRLFLQWEGPADEWTGTPQVSGQYVPRNNTTAIGGNHARRFEGFIDLDLSTHSGTTVTLPFVYQNVTKSVDVQIAGGGPEIVNFEFISTPDHGQTHYKDGDDIQFVVMFNTTDVVSYSLERANDTVTKSYTDVNITMNGVSATITAECDTSVTTITNLPVRIKAKNALGTETPNWYESSDTVQALNGPVVTNVTYGSYPGVQTELKHGDTVPVTFEFDTNNVNQVRLDGSGDNTYASSDQTISVTTTTFSANTTMTVDTSLQNNTGGFDRPVRVQARNSNNKYRYGNNHTSVEMLTVNNQRPTFSSAAITYPAGQQAIKSGESATVNITVSNQGNDPTYTYSDNNRNELTIPNTAVYTPGKTVNYNTGTYNITSPNYKLQVHRKENDNTASTTTVVFVAAVAPTINITTNNGTDLRSGGNDGTTMQNYNVVMTSDQRLDSKPTLAAPMGTLGEFTYSATSTTFTSTIGIHDNDTRGQHTYNTLNTTNLAGISQTTINSGDTYTIRGFVIRTLTIVSQGWQTQANVAAVNYNKVEIDWEKKDLNNRATLGDTTRPQSNTWSLDRLDPAPITVNILDSGATNASSSPTTLTIEEKL